MRLIIISFHDIKATKIMIVNCEEVDFVNNAADFDDLVNEIFKSDQSAVKYYNPSLRKTAQ